ncbi:hypothetical protein IFM89_021468 [Coptis chinensis]|uniref:MCAfunc domain-containing protein n=1 Tax=Coptis chinensis TaxID=261450 RepID=A0A835MBZ1_9MAGN|nr:hypothetical protein IFM89_021468 [Coptis chinensis]
MAASWEHFGELANVAQLTGLDAVRLIGMIVKAAATARMHKKNCRQFAMHLKLIGNLLEQLRISELKRYPETREPLEQLEDALRRSYVLVNSCQDRSYLYLLAMGWNIVYHFRRAQEEIDRYLRLVPLITLVDNARVKERLEYIERDQHEYTLDEEDRQVQTVILKPEPSTNDTMVLKKSLSCSYNLPIDKALRKENEKLQMELQMSQANMDVGQCQVIQHLLDVTESAACSLPEKEIHLQFHRGMICYQLKDHIGMKSGIQIYLTVAQSHLYVSRPFSILVARFQRLLLWQLTGTCGGFCDDFLSHLLCCCCALVQEWREVEIRGVYGPEKTKISPPTSQYMES